MQDFDFFKQNAGVQNMQHGVRLDSYVGLGGSGISGDVTEIDHSVDQTLVLTCQTVSNATSFCGWLRDFSVKYGA